MYKIKTQNCRFYFTYSGYKNHFNVTVNLHCPHVCQVLGSFLNGSRQLLDGFYLFKYFTPFNDKVCGVYILTFRP